MKNPYGYIPTKEYPYTCVDDECGSQAYHLSTIKDHAVSTLSVGGEQIRSKTLLIRCRSGHTLPIEKTYKTNVLAAHPGRREE